MSHHLPLHRKFLAKRPVRNTKTVYLLYTKKNMLISKPTNYNSLLIYYLLQILLNETFSTNLIFITKTIN